MGKRVRAAIATLLSNIKIKTSMIDNSARIFVGCTVSSWSDDDVILFYIFGTVGSF